MAENRQVYSCNTKNKGECKMKALRLVGQTGFEKVNVNGFEQIKKVLGCRTLDYQEYTIPNTTYKVKLYFDEEFKLNGGISRDSISVLLTFKGERKAYDFLTDCILVAKDESVIKAFTKALMVSEYGITYHLNYL
jgi:hypothetical protein